MRPITAFNGFLAIAANVGAWNSTAGTYAFYCFIFASTGFLIATILSSFTPATMSPKRRAATTARLDRDLADAHFKALERQYVAENLAALTELDKAWIQAVNDIAGIGVSLDTPAEVYGPGNTPDKPWNSGMDHSGSVTTWCSETGFKRLCPGCASSDSEVEPRHVILGTYGSYAWHFACHLKETGCTYCRYSLRATVPDLIEEAYAQFSKELQKETASRNKKMHEFPTRPITASSATDSGTFWEDQGYKYQIALPYRKEQRMPWEVRRELLDLLAKNKVYAVRDDEYQVIRYQSLDPALLAPIEALLNPAKKAPRIPRVKRQLG